MDIKKIKNFLLTENAVITGKNQTGILTERTEPRGRGPYVKDPSLIFSSNDQADEVNEKFITWLVLNKQNIPNLAKNMFHSYSVTKSR